MKTWRMPRLEQNSSIWSMAGELVEGRQVLDKCDSFVKEEERGEVRPS